MRRLTTIMLTLAGTLALRHPRRPGQRHAEEDPRSNVRSCHRDASILSYYDDKQPVVPSILPGIVDAIKTELKMPWLEVKCQLLTSEPHSADGERHDRPECGSTITTSRNTKKSRHDPHFLTANASSARGGESQVILERPGKT